jgi:hypothetical protein
LNDAEPPRLSDEFISAEKAIQSGAQNLSAGPQSRASNVFTGVESRSEIK